jgi:hypothetical protein
LERFVQFSEYYEATLEEALTRGVRIRHVIEAPMMKNKPKTYFAKKSMRTLII